MLSTEPDTSVGVPMTQTNRSGPVRFPRERIETIEMGFRFGEFELSNDGILRKSGEDLRIAAKPLSFLRCLIHHRNRFVSRSELSAAAWPNEHVGQAAFASVLRDTRRILGDHARESRFIETRRGVGFRFVHGVVEKSDDEAISSRWNELVGHFQNALSGLERIGTSRGGTPSTRSMPRERGPLLIALGRARWGAGATEAARSDFRAAIDLARAIGDAEMFAQAALGFAGRSDASLAANAQAIELLEEALDLLDVDSDHLALRSEVAARLGTELYHCDGGSAAREMTAVALRLAEESKVPSAIGYALTARHFSLNRAEFAPSVRRPLADRAIALVEDDQPSDILALGLQERLADLLEEGNGAEFDATFLHYDRVVEHLAQPFFLWMRSILAASRMIRAGKLAEALELAPQLLTRGLEIGSPNAQAAYIALLFSVRHAQGQLGELFSFVDGVEGQGGVLPIMRAAVAAIAETGEDKATVRARLQTLIADLPSIPRDANWLGLLGILSPTVARTGDEEWCRTLYDLLAPFSDRIVVAGHGVLFFGAVDHHLGLLAARLGMLEISRGHLDFAARRHEECLAPLWLERTRSARQ